MYLTYKVHRSCAAVPSQSLPLPLPLPRTRARAKVSRPKRTTSWPCATPFPRRVCIPSRHSFDLRSSPLLAEPAHSSSRRPIRPSYHL